MHWQPPLRCWLNNRAINEALNEPATEKQLARLHVVPVGGSPADMRKLVQEEIKRWEAVIKEAGIKPR